MGLKTLKSGKVCIVSFEEEVNMEILLEVEKQIKRIIKEGERYILFDLSRLKRLSSIGIRIFTSAIRGLKEIDGVLKISNVRPPINKLFKLLNLIELLNIYPSVDDALQAFNE